VGTGVQVRELEVLRLQEQALVPEDRTIGLHVLFLSGRRKCRR
jgi:hypothetical protein